MELRGILRRALNFKNLCEYMPVVIHEDEMIVGTQAETYRGCALFPEINASWFARELSSDTLSTRECDPYDIDPHDVQEVVSTVDFWLHNSCSACFDSFMPPEYSAHEGNGIIDWRMQGSASMPIGHVCPDFKRILNKGLRGIQQEIHQRLTAMEGKMFGHNAEVYTFLRAVSIICDSVCLFSQRYAAACREMAMVEKNEKRRHELEQMADTLGWIFENPCRSFFDALQAIYLYQLCICMDGQQHGNSLGRIDQALGPYYERDIKAGKITQEQAQEWIDLFVLKLAEMNKMGPDGAALGAPGYSGGQLITVGGVNENGEDAANGVTYAFLMASARLLLHDPPVALRIHKNTPDELWHLAIAVTARCGGVPTLENDEVIIEALMKRGLPLEVARDYALVGCLEPMVPGKEFGCPGGSGMQSFFVLANVLLQAINNGINPMSLNDASGGRQTGVATGYLYEMETFDDVLSAVKQQVDYWADWWVSLTNLYESVAAEELPLPLISLTTDGCLESGRDVMKGGALYNSCGIAAIGFGNMVDSLNVIRTLCYESKKVPKRELYNALMNNWKGYEDLQWEIKNHMDHYGNGIARVDELATWVGHLFCDKISQCEGPRGKFAPGIWPVTMHVLYGHMTWATPDGRCAGEPLSDGIGPVQGMDQNGPTAMLLSAAKLDQRQCSNGTLLNLRLHPTALQAPGGLEKFRQLLETYFEQHGMQLQINVISGDMLRDAQQNPEDYQDLVVRIAGFSAYFVQVYKEAQDDLIRRTEFMI